MSQLVVLNLGKGDWQQGCPTVTAQLWEADSRTPMQFTGSLPPAPDLGILYPDWQKLYEALYAHKSWRRLRAVRPDTTPEIEIDEADLTHLSDVEFDALCQNVRSHLNRWLNAESFHHIDRQLRTRLAQHEEIRVIMTADNPALLRLPWSLWQFLEDYPKAEIALSRPDYTRALKAPSDSHNLVRILAILGNRTGIDLDRDRAILQQLPNAQVTFLVEPDLFELNYQLWDNTWDILFFAGHSSSDESGKLQINPTESLTLEQLKYGLRKAIAHGLKLAIFNSCDGLGLAWDLADLQIPQVIVMREPVPDRVAQEFLKHFLASFAGGQSLYLAVREAREKLQALESQYPCATWLPIICQNPAEIPPHWQDWCGKAVPDEMVLPIHPLDQGTSLRSRADSSTASRRIGVSWQGLNRVLLSSLLATGVVLGVRSLGLLQSVELWTFDRLIQARPLETPDPRLLVVTIDEADIQAQNEEDRRGSLSDASLYQLLQTLEQYEPRVIGLDIYRDFSVSAAQANLATWLSQDDRFVAICKGRDPQYDPTGIAPPPEIPEDRVGFSDFLEDADGILRRQIIAMTPDPASECTTPYSFSSRLVFLYLQAEGITPEFTPDGNLKLGNTVVSRLTNRMGGYQTIDARGNQVMVNYRALKSPTEIAPQVSLSQLLNGSINPNAIRDRIVLIGVSAGSGGDYWSTPYGAGFAERTPGVFVQAQMVSQLLSAVLDQRPLLWAWTWWAEGIWVGVWAIAGGTLGVIIARPLRLAIALIFSVGGLSVLSLIILIQGGWVPLIPALLGLIASLSLVKITGGPLPFSAGRIHR